MGVTVASLAGHSGTNKLVDYCASKVVPILEPEFVAEETVKAILMNKPVLILPGWCMLLITLKSLLKTDPYIRLAQTFGFNCSMDQFEGRASPSKEIENIK